MNRLKIFKTVALVLLSAIVIVLSVAILSKKQNKLSSATDGDIMLTDKLISSENLPKVHLTDNDSRNTESLAARNKLFVDNILNTPKQTVKGKVVSFNLPSGLVKTENSSLSGHKCYKENFIIKNNTLLLGDPAWVEDPACSYGLIESYLYAFSSGDNLEEDISFSLDMLVESIPNNSEYLTLYGPSRYSDSYIVYSKTKKDWNLYTQDKESDNNIYTINNDHKSEFIFYNKESFISATNNIGDECGYYETFAISRNFKYRVTIKRETCIPFPDTPNFNKRFESLANDFLASLEIKE